MTGGSFIRYPSFNAVIKVDQSERMEYMKAQCCLYLLIFYLLLLFIVIGILYFIYGHHKAMKMK